MIRHIQFRGDVAVHIGTHRLPVAINSWSRDKHAKDCDVEVKADCVLLWPLENGHRRGDLKRVPMSSVAYFDEVLDKPPVSAK